MKQNLKHNPNNGYEYDDRKSNVGQIVIIFIAAVIIAALAVTLLVVLQKRDRQALTETAPAAPTEEEITIVISIEGSKERAIVNGKPEKIGVYMEDDRFFVALKDIADVAGDKFIREKKVITIRSEHKQAILKIGSKKVETKDFQKEKELSTEIVYAPVVKNGVVYVFVRDLPVLMHETKIDYNAKTKSAEITIIRGSIDKPIPAFADGQEEEPKDKNPNEPASEVSELPSSKGILDDLPIKQKN